jgi:hypothetical protein
MFSKHALQFDRLITEGMTVGQVSVLKSILTNPDIELEHHGVIKLTGSIEGPTVKASKWAICNTNWEYVSLPPSQGGGMAFVYAHECDDSSGKNKVGDLRKIYLPVSPSQDPNLEAGDVINFITAEDGTDMASGYGDARIGSLQNNTRIEEKTKGWGLLNGTNNSIAKGGSGIDARDKFLRQWSSSSNAGSTGGAAATNLTIEGTFTANDIGNHSHTLQETTIGTGSESTVTVITSTPTGDSGVDLGTISVSFTGASGSGSPTAATIPPFVYVATYERLDNSKNKVG